MLLIVLVILFMTNTAIVFAVEDEETWQYYYDKSNIKYKLREYEKALSFIDLALDINNKIPAIYKLKGEIYIKLHKFNEAIFCYDEALKLGEHEATFYLSKGIAYLYLKENEKAVNLFKCLEG